MSLCNNSSDNKSYWIHRVDVKVSAQVTTVTYMHQSQPSLHSLRKHLTVHLELWPGNHLIWCNATCRFLMICLTLHFTREHTDTVGFYDLFNPPFHQRTNRCSRFLNLYHNHPPTYLPTLHFTREHTLGKFIDDMYHHQSPTNLPTHPPFHQAQCWWFVSPPITHPSTPHFTRHYQTVESLLMICITTTPTHLPIHPYFTRHFHTDVVSWWFVSQPPPPHPSTNPPLFHQTFPHRCGVLVICITVNWSLVPQFLP